MNARRCPPCRQDCNQGRQCPAFADTMAVPPPAPGAIKSMNQHRRSRVDAALLAGVVALVGIISAASMMAG